MTTNSATPTSEATLAPTSTAPSAVAVDSASLAPIPNLLGTAPEGAQSSEGGGADSTGGDSATAGADSVGSDTAGGDSVDADSAGGDSTTGDDSTAEGTDTLTAASYDVLTIPEGMEPIDPLIAEFKSFALENKLPPAQAQRLLDMQATAARAGMAAQLESFNTTQAAWVAEYSAWPEFTGTRSRETTTASLGKLFDEFGTPEVREVMSLTGAGNNPSLIRMMLNISKALEEGGPTAPGRPNGVKYPRTPGQILYPNQPES